MVAGAGEGHREQHRAEAGEPLPVHAREHARQPLGQHAVAVVEELIAGDQRHAGIDQRSHVAQAQYLRALDVEVFRQQHDGDAHHVDSDNQAHRQLQRVDHEAGHVAREKEAYDREGVHVPRGVPCGEDRGQRVQAGQHHEAQEEIDEQYRAKDLVQQGQVEPAPAPLSALHVLAPLLSRT